MARLVVVISLEEGKHEEARQLLADGPPMDLESTQYERHEVFMTRDEVVFVFESPEGVPATLGVHAGDPAFWRAAAAWQRIMRGRPRIAETVFEWEREAPG